MLKLYTTPTCTMVASVRAVLDEIGQPYIEIDITQDKASAEIVREITGGFESVPTLDFGDTRYMVEPSPEAVRQALAPNSPQPDPTPIIYQRWVWLWIFPALLVGYIVFALGIEQGRRMALSREVSIAILVGLLAMGVLMLVPPIRNLFRKVQHRLRGFGIQWILTYGMAFLAGIFFSANADASLTTGIIMLGGVGVMGLVWLTYMSRHSWERIQPLLLWINPKLSLVMLGITIIFVIVLSTNADPKTMTSFTWILFGFAFLAFIMALLQCAKGLQTMRIADNVASVLTASIGLVVMINFAF